jgi:hypothetical protein
LFFSISCNKSAIGDVTLVIGLLSQIKNGEATMKSRWFATIAAVGTVMAGMSVYAEPNDPPQGPPPPPQKERRGDDIQGERPPRGDNKRGGFEAHNPQLGEMLLKNKYPDDVKAIEDLKKTDPAKAREAMETLKKKAFETFRAEQEDLKNMADKYRESKSQSDLDKLKEKIKSMLDNKLEMEKKMIEKGDEQLKMQQEKLAKFKAEHEKRMNNKDKMVENKLKEMTEPQELKF